MGASEPSAIRDAAEISAAAPRIGLLAGWGRYPFVVAEALRRRGCRTFCLGVAGQADAALAGVCDDFQWIGLARLGQAIRYFKRQGITRATMAGKVHKKVVFQPWLWVRLLPDLRTLRALAPHFLTGRKDCRDDSLLRMVVDEFAADGIQFAPATDFAPELLARPGQRTRRAPSARHWRDIHFGWKIAKELGRLDIGQTVAVKNQAVLALEAVEGTDECIRRAGGLCRAGGFVVVKVAKPQQDMRFDVPTIGLGTLQTMVQAGGRVLAIEAGRTILLEEPCLIDYANRNKLVIVALEDAFVSPPGRNAAGENPLHGGVNVPEHPCPSRER
jgi:DUF1009 family protein